MEKKCEKITNNSTPILFGMTFLEKLKIKIYRLQELDDHPQIY